MSDHLDLCSEHLIKPERLQSLQESKPAASLEQNTSLQNADNKTCEVDIDQGGKQGFSEEEEPLLNTVECRICQEEDSPKNLEAPCACCGSLKFAHRKCVQHWCNEKGDTICEICHQPYQPGYSAPPAPQSDDTVIDIRENLAIGGTPLDLNDARLLAMTAAERQILEAEYDEYADSSASGAAFCRSAALILIALILLRHAASLQSDDDEDNASTFFSLFLLRAASFLLPCYIMAWAVSILQRRRQRQEEEAALAATEVAFMLQAGQNRGLPVAVEPGSVIIPHQESSG